MNLRTIFPGLLLASLVSSIVPLASLSAEEFGDFTYRRLPDNSAVEITDYPTTATGHIDIPVEIDGLPVTRIGNSAFSGCAGLTGVGIPEGVTTIGMLAFRDCRGLTSITLPASLSGIGLFPFGGCSGLESIAVQGGNANFGSAGGVLYDSTLTELILYPEGKSGAFVVPEGVAKIAPSAFYECIGLTEVTLPDSLLSIDGWAFLGCSGLADVAFGSGVETIGDSAFEGCTGLTAIVTPPNVTTIGNRAFAGCSRLAVVDLPAGLVSIGDHAFSDCWDLQNIDIPAGIGGIVEGLFQNCVSLRACTIPSGITSMGAGAFQGCTMLPEILIPDGMTSIGGGAFKGCTSLTHVTIPDSVTTIAGQAFQACTGLLTAILPDGITSISINTFDGCHNLAEIAIPSGVTSIGSEAFAGCSGLSGITIPGGVTSIGSEAFAGCSGLSDVTIPDGVTSIGSMVFQGCSSLQSLVLPENTETIGTWAFADCTALASITIPSRTTSIDIYAFSGCSSLESIILPVTLTTVGDGAFSGCSALNEVTFLGDAPAIGSDVFSGIHPAFTIYYLDGNHGFSGPSWTGYPVAVFPLGSLSYRIVGNAASIEITGCSGSISGHLTIPGDLLGIPVTRIGGFAFYGQDNLTGVNIPPGVTSIGSFAFSSCASLGDVTIPAAVASIGTEAFSACSSLRAAVFVGDAPVLGEDVFSGVDPMFTIYYSAGSSGFSSPLWNGYPAVGQVTGLLSYRVIDGGTAIEITGYPPGETGHLAIPADIGGIPVTSIGEGAFAGCGGLTGITIPAGVNRIGDRAFADCSLLATIAIPESLASIGVQAFENCLALTGIIVPSGVTSIGRATFEGCASLESCTLPPGVTTIGSHAFAGCRNLAAIDFGVALTSIGNNAFDRCSSLVNVSIPAGVRSLDREVFANCGGLTAVTLAQGLAVIGDRAFAGCSNLAAPVLPPTVTGINAGAFSYCPSLTAVDIPSGVTHIDTSAFVGCTALSSISVAAGNMVYASAGGVLHNASLTELLLCPEGRTGVFAVSEGVTRIGSAAFADCWQLSGIILPSTVASIAGDAFYGCAGLTGLVLPDGLEEIGDGAFSGCASLPSIAIPGSVGEIGSYAFFGCTGLSTATIAEGVTAIGSHAFRNCTGLITFNIPASVSTIGRYAFRGCRKLASISVEAGNPAFTSIDGVLHRSIGSATSLFLCPEGMSGVYVISDLTLSIREEAFANCDLLVGVVLPESIEHIEGRAFFSCDGLSDIVIPSSVLSIGNEAFLDCTGLMEAVFLDDSPLVAEGSRVFDNSAPSFTVYFPEGAAGFSAPVWRGYRAEPHSPFTYRHAGGMLEVTGHPRSVVWKLEVPDEVRGIPVVGIWYEAFRNYGGDFSGLTGITLPSSISIIRDRAFYDCANLETALFLGNAPTLGSDVFAATAPGFTVHYLDNSSGFTTPTWNGYPTAVQPSGLFSYQVIGGVEVEITGYPTIEVGPVTVPATFEGLPVTRIGDNAFDGCSGLTSIGLPATVSIIGNRAFRRCSGLTAISLPEGLADIGTWAFSYCSNLTSLTLPSTVANISLRAFAYCDDLTAVTLPAGLVSLGAGVFANCGGLQSILVEPGNPYYVDVDGVVFSADLTTLYQYPTGRAGSYAIPPGTTAVIGLSFNGSIGLTELTIPASVASIYYRAFGYCEMLTAISVEPGNPGYMDVDGVLFNLAGTELIQFPGGLGGDYGIPAGVADIDGYAFAGCDGLTGVSLPAGVAGLANSAFNDCTALGYAIFRGDAPTMGTRVFDDTAPAFTVYYLAGSSGFSSPTWNGYPATEIDEGVYPAGTWLLRQGLAHDSDLTSDPDRDGISLGTEFVHNLDPNRWLPADAARSYQGLPVIEQVPGGMALVYRRNLDAAGFTFTVEESDDLGISDPWTAAAVNESILEDDGQTRILRAALADDGASRRFLRLVVGEEPPPDLAVDIALGNSNLVPRGHAEFTISYRNLGGIDHVTAQIRNTLPPGLVWDMSGSECNWVAGPWTGQPCASPVVIGNQLIWDLPGMSRGVEYAFAVRLVISESATPGPVLQNCAEILDASGEGPDGNIIRFPDGDSENNTSCVSFQVDPAS